MFTSMAANIFLLPEEARNAKKKSTQFEMYIVNP